MRDQTIPKTQGLDLARGSAGDLARDLARDLACDLACDLASAPSLTEALASLGLCVMGALPLARSAAQPPYETPRPQLETSLAPVAPEDSMGQLLILGATPGLWPVFSTSPEARDQMADPLDRWSRRVIDDLAQAFDAQAIYPFGGAPYAPFVKWALASGRFFTSPSQMMVHDTYGLMISLRGALWFATDANLTPEDGYDGQHGQSSPCRECAAPCLSACPVAALPRGGPYDVPRCQSHLATQAGAGCYEAGCLARAACPLSRNAARSPAQNCHHMVAFCPRPTAPDASCEKA